MKEKLPKPESCNRSYSYHLSLGFIIFVSLCCFTSYMINTENKLPVNGRMEAKAPDPTNGRTEVVHEVFTRHKRSRPH